ncbi:MAG: hypothetical protein IJM87_10625 [Ruminococcus sp.]|nr:hypothetical protein [Ruminococcus sp.]
MPTLEERVTALETVVAAIQGEGDYELSKAGETIDAILSGIEHAAIYHGRDEITVSDTSTAMAFVNLSLGFSASATTKVVAAVRYDSAPTPYNNVILTLHRSGSTMIASITAGYNVAGGTTRYLPRGSYPIDWICFDKGD